MPALGSAIGRLPFTPGGSLTRTISAQVRDDGAGRGGRGDVATQDTRDRRRQRGDRRHTARHGLAVADACAAEGESLTFTVSPGTASSQEAEAEVVTARDLTFTVSPGTASGRTVTVDWTTAAGIAFAAHGDYDSASGTLTFKARETAKTVTVTTVDDSEEQTFTVTLTNTGNAVNDDATATGTINDDDPPVTVAFGASSCPSTTGAWSR